MLDHGDLSRHQSMDLSSQCWNHELPQKVRDDKCWESVQTLPPSTRVPGSCFRLKYILIHILELQDTGTAQV